MNLIDTMISHYDFSDIIHEIVILLMLLMLLFESRIRVRWTR